MPGPNSGIVCRMVRHVAVIDLRGPFVQERTFPLLQERIRELLDEGAKNFAINLSEVHCADSYTLGGLAGAYNLIRQAGGRIKFFAVSEQLRRTIKKLHLDTVLELADDEASALSSFH